MVSKEEIKKRREQRVKWRKQRPYVFTGIIIVLSCAILFGMNITKPTYEEPNVPRPFYGLEEADVVVLEFLDLECPACRAAHPTINRIKEDYKDQIRFEAKHFPLYQIHPRARKAHEAAECAHDQGKYFEMIDLIFQYQENIGVSNLKQFAVFLELDSEKFNVCLDSGVKSKYINADLKEGASLGVQGTPTIFVNGVQLQNWQYDSFSQRIEEELAKVEN